jgi:hypothetical protein
MIGRSNNAQIAPQQMSRQRSAAHKREKTGAITDNVVRDLLASINTSRQSGRHQQRLAPHHVDAVTLLRLRDDLDSVTNAWSEKAESPAALAKSLSRLEILIDQVCSGIALHRQAVLQELGVTPQWQLANSVQTALRDVQENVRAQALRLAARGTRTRGRPTSPLRAPINLLARIWEEWTERAATVTRNPYDPSSTRSGHFVSFAKIVLEAFAPERRWDRIGSWIETLLAERAERSLRDNSAARTD